MNPNSAQRVPNPFRAVNKQVTQGTKPSVLNSLVTRATLWLSNTKSHGLLKKQKTAVPTADSRSKVVSDNILRNNQRFRPNV